VATVNYRDSVYNSGDQMLQRLGSFWSVIFNDREQLRTMFQGEFLEAGQAYLNFLEATACLNRHQTPVFHREDWFLLRILESEVTTDILKYGDGSQYGDPIQYGMRVRRDRYAVDLQGRLKNVRFLLNRITGASLTLTSGLDFFCTDTELVFRANPFDNPLVPKRNILDAAGNVIDREAGLWGYGGLFDLEYLWYHWGYALHAYMQSSNYYKDFLNALADAYIGTPSRRAIHQLFSALTGVPLVLEDTEIVEAVLLPAESTQPRQVVTDQHVYLLTANANVIVTVGQELHGGDSLTDGLRIIDTGVMPTSQQLPGLALDAAFLHGAYCGAMFFTNQSVPLEYYGVDENGKADVRFEVGGFDTDVLRFWATVQARGLQDGKTLAEYLDKREVQTTPPAPNTLPTTINPMELIYTNLLKNNTFFVIMKPQQFPDKAPSRQFFDFLRRALPPHITYLVYVELQPESDYIDYSSATYLTDEQAFFGSLDAGTEDIPDSWVEESITLVQVKDC
jgi:hypothetical protein